MQIIFVHYCILCRFYLSSISCIALLLLHKLVCRSQASYYRPIHMGAFYVARMDGHTSARCLQSRNGAVVT